MRASLWTKWSFGIVIKMEIQAKVGYRLFGNEKTQIKLLWNPLKIDWNHGLEEIDFGSFSCDRVYEICLRFMDCMSWLSAWSNITVGRTLIANTPQTISPQWQLSLSSQSGQLPKSTTTIPLSTDSFSSTPENSVVTSSDNSKPRHRSRNSDNKLPMLLLTTTDRHSWRYYQMKNHLGLLYPPHQQLSLSSLSADYYCSG